MPLKETFWVIFARKQPTEMKNNQIMRQSGLIAGMILIAALSRFLPHPHNFTPLGAMALFGAAHFHRKYLAVLVPFAALWLSDLVLNNLILARQFPQYYQEGFVWFTSIWIYLGFFLIAALGWLALQKVNVPRLLGVSVSASLIFFLTTNFGVWAESLMYPKTLAGLSACYAAGIPFFWNTLLGDLVYTGIMFGAYAWISMRAGVKAEA